MSHFTVMVIGENSEKLLAPFQENNMGDCPKEFLKYKAYPKDDSDTRWFDSKEQAQAELGTLFDEDNSYEENPNAKWDWWVIGGRWSNFLLLKSGERSDISRAGDIDFETMRTLAEQRERPRYESVHKIIAGRSVPNWDETRDRHSKDFDAARNEYNTNEVIVAVRESKLLGFFENIEAFDCSQEDYIKRVRNEATSTFAVVKDGAWYERGSMGWWGFASNEKDSNEWAEQIATLLNGLSESETVTIVDCHI